MKVKSMRGRVFDMSQLIANNQKAVALGNASMNARGDIVNRKGDIVKPRAQIIPQYNADNPKAVKQVALRDLPSEVFITPAEAAAAFKKPENTQATPEANPTTTRKRVIKD